MLWTECHAHTTKSIADSCAGFLGRNQAILGIPLARTGYPHPRTNRFHFFSIGLVRRTRFIPGNYRSSRAGRATRPSQGLLLGC